MSILEMKEEVLRLSKEERLQALEVLWDAILEQKDEPESPAWHGEVLAARLAKAEAGEAEFLTMDELRTRLRLLIEKNPEAVPDPVAAIGFAQRHGLPGGTTADWMTILREGED